MKKTLLFSFLFSCHLTGSKSDADEVKVKSQTSPNILIAMSDDQSYPHTGAYGAKMVNTPAFDRVAENGILFHNAFAAAPGCAPSRSSLLTGRYQWQNEEAGGHQTLFPQKYVTYPTVLEHNGYHIGHTGKGASPFNLSASGRDRNPAGPGYNDIRYDLDNDARWTEAFNSINYSANFAAFLEARDEDQPFHFFYGSTEPHRSYQKGSGQHSGKRLEDVDVPGFFPDHETIRSDMLDYAFEIEWFDYHLMKMIEMLEEIGELDNTIIIVTSDQGMPFPRAKANLYDFGLRVPLAISWPDVIIPGREIRDLINLSDIAPTLLEITETNPEPMLPMSAVSFTNILYSDQSGIVGASREAVYAGMERHSSARWANLGYPKRSMRTHDYLYIHNFTPERWPAGAPQTLRRDNPDELHFMHGLDEDGKFTGEAYYDIDNSPTKAFLIENMDVPEVRKYFDLAVAKRPAEELYAVHADPYNMVNLAQDPEYAKIVDEMREMLFDFLRETEDPRVVGPVYDVFENYQRFHHLRPFPRPDWIIQQ